MDLNLVDAELIPTLEAIPEFDIWADLSVTRLLSLQRNTHLASMLPPIENIGTADYIVPQSGDEGVPVRVYGPKSQTNVLPALLWIHGGGYCFGSLMGDDYTVKRMAEAIGCVVISVDYRLAPEFPFPTPLNDCYAALTWVFDNAEMLKVDASRIAIGGISAGGGLAAGLALLARDRAEVTVVFQALLCPMIDNNSTSVSSYSISDNRIWNRRSNLEGWMHYLGRKTTSEQEPYVASKYAAPSHAGDLHGLPPAYIGVGSVDLFLDENRDYAERLNGSGVATQLEIFPGGYHGFEFMVPNAKISRFARDTHYRAIKLALFE
jgi:acetyl esterase/lipase